MVHINSSDYKIDIQMYEELIQKDGFDMYIDSFEYICALQEAHAVYMSLSEALRVMITFITNGNLTSVSPQAVGMVLKDNFHIETMNLLKTTSRGVSLDIKTVFQPLKDYAVKNLKRKPAFYSMIIEFCNLYTEYSHAKSLINSLSSKLDNGMIRESNVVDNKGNRLRVISSFYEKQSTGRYYTKNDNLQGWNKKVLDTFSAPKDYFFVWADFDQIDFRVAANLILFKDTAGTAKDDLELFNSTDDKYEAMARIIDKKIGRDFDIARFKANRKAYKTSMLARLYGASKRTLMNNGFTDYREVNTLDTYYATHKYYQNYKRSIENAIAFGCEVDVYDYFGYTRRVPVPTNIKQGNRVLEDCLNAPIQSTANDIIMLWVTELAKEFQALGFGMDKFRIALIRHDEAIFLIHKDAIPYLYLFKKYSEIQIDDWTLLTNQPEVGFKYTVVDEELTKKYNESILYNEDKLDDGKSVMIRKSWSPLKRVAEAYFFYASSISMFAYQALSLDNNTVEDAEEIHQLIMSKGEYDKETINCAKRLLLGYINNANNGGMYEPNVLDLINNYRRYAMYAVVNILDGERDIRVEKKDFIKYCKDNDIGYVYIFNHLFGKNYLIIDDIQLKYSDNCSYQTLVNILEAHHDKGDKR